MAVKVIIRRQIGEGHLEEAYKLLTRARYNASYQEGYISSETLTSIDNANSVVVISTWESIENWEKWKNSDIRSDGESRLDEITDVPAEYETFTMGVKYRPSR